MKPNASFQFTPNVSDIDNTEKVMITVSDDDATDQDVLMEIQTKSIYKTRKLVMLYEAEAGVWVAYFKIP